MLFATTWMDQEIVILSEVSQRMRSIIWHPFCWNSKRNDANKLTKRHYFADKSSSSQSYGFSRVMYGCESWTIKKTERQRSNAFELWCWRRLLRAPWTARRSNQSIPKKISTEYSLKGVMLKLKLQYFGLLLQGSDSLEKTLMLGKDWRQEEKGTTEDEVVGWNHLLNGHEFEQALGVGDG